MPLEVQNPEQEELWDNNKSPIHKPKSEDEKRSPSLVESLLEKSNAMLANRQHDVVTLLKELQDQQEDYESQIKSLSKQLERLIDMNQKQAIKLKELTRPTKEYIMYL